MIFRNLFSMCLLGLTLIAALSCSNKEGSQAASIGQYTSLRSIMKSGGILLSSAEKSGCPTWDVGNDALKFLKQAPKFCHAMIVWDVHPDYVDVIDATPEKGVSIRRKHREEIMNFWNTGRLVSLHTSANGKNVLAAAKRLIGSKFCWPLKVNFDNPDTCLYCSAFVWTVFKSVGIVLKDRASPVFWVTPDDIKSSSKTWSIVSN